MICWLAVSTPGRASEDPMGDELRCDEIAEAVQRRCLALMQVHVPGPCGSTTTGGLELPRAVDSPFPGPDSVISWCGEVY